MADYILHTKVKKKHMRKKITFDVFFSWLLVCLFWIFVPHAIIVVKLKTISYHALAARSFCSLFVYHLPYMCPFDFFLLLLSIPIATEIKIMDYFMLTIKAKEEECDDDDEGDEEATTGKVFSFLIFVHSYSDHLLSFSLACSIEYIRFMFFYYYILVLLLCAQV